MCLRQLGIRLASTPGAITGLLGREIVHDITEWTDFDAEVEKRGRISVLHKTHESVRLQVLQNLEKRKKRARLEAPEISEQEASKR